MNTIFDYIQNNEKLLKILNDIEATGINLKFELTDDLNNKTSLGQHCFDSKNLISKIKIKPCAKNEAIISHELLHSYLFSKKFPRIKKPYIKNNNLETLVTRIANSLCHKLIQEIQDELLIDTRNINLDSLKEIYNFNPENIDSFMDEFFFSLSIFDAMLSCYKEWDEYKILIKEKFPKPYSYAKLLYDSAMSFSYKTSHEYRKAFIRVMNTCNKINAKPILFNILVEVDFIPNEEEYEFLVKDIFDIKTLPYLKDLTYLLFSKEDNQLSYLLTVNSENDLEKILSYKLKKFYELDVKHLLI